MLNKQNDKSSLTGLLLMAAILIIFNVFVFNNTEEQINNENSNSEKTIQKENSEKSAISIENQKETIIDSTEIITETEYILENDKVKLTFTNKGGEIKSAIIKGFYSYDEYKKNLDDNTYQSQDIEIFNNKDSKFEITADRNISSDVFFTVMESNNSITFRKDFDSDNFIEYIYTLNEASNFVDFTITSPPYNTGGISLCVGDFYKEYKDNLTNDEYYNFIKKNINELLRVTKHYVFYNFQFLSNNKNIYFNIIGEFSHKIKDVFIWEKASAVAQINKGKMATGFEVVLILSKNNNNMIFDYNNFPENNYVPNIKKFNKLNRRYWN